MDGAGTGAHPTGYGIWRSEWKMRREINVENWTYLGGGPSSVATGGCMRSGSRVLLPRWDLLVRVIYVQT